MTKVTEMNMERLGAAEAYLGLSVDKALDKEQRWARVSHEIAKRFRPQPDWPPEDPRWEDADLVDSISDVVACGNPKCERTIPYDSSIKECWFCGNVAKWSPTMQKRYARPKGWGAQDHTKPTPSVALTVADAGKAELQKAAPADLAVPAVTTLVEAESHIMRLERGGAIAAYQIGRLYAAIRDQRLYEADGFQNFSAYVDARGRGRPYVSQCMALAGTFKSQDEVAAIGVTAAREIAKSKDEKVVAKLVEAAKGGASTREIAEKVSKVNARIREARSLLPPKAPKGKKAEKQEKPAEKPKKKARETISVAELVEISPLLVTPGEPVEVAEAFELQAKITPAGKVSLRFVALS